MVPSAARVGGMGGELITHQKLYHAFLKPCLPLLHIFYIFCYIQVLIGKNMNESHLPSKYHFPSFENMRALIRPRENVVSYVSVYCMHISTLHCIVHWIKID